MSARWPDLEVLELLVAVAEVGSIGAASARLGVSQPSASTSITRLERRLGLTLVTRSSRGSVLTPEGSLYVDWARDVLAAADRLRLATAALRAERNSHLALAASMTTAEHLVPRWLAAFRREHGDVDVNLAVLNSAGVAEAVRDGSRDLGFVETAGAPRGLSSATVATDELVVVVAPGHPWTRRRAHPVTAEELARTALVVREEGSGTLQTLVEAFRARGLTLVEPAQALSSNTAVRVAATAGTAPAVLSRLAVVDAVAAGDLVVVPVQDLSMRRRLRAVWAGGRRPVGHAADFVAVARRDGSRVAARDDA